MSAVVAVPSCRTKASEKKHENEKKQKNERGVVLKAEEVKRGQRLGVTALWARRRGHGSTARCV